MNNDIEHYTIEETLKVTVEAGVLYGLSSTHSVKSLVEQLHTLINFAINQREARAGSEAVAEHLDVRKIMLDVVPGDGSGLEVYATCIADVEALLSDMGTRLEDYALRTPPSTNQAVRDAIEKAAGIANEKIANRELAHFIASKIRALLDGQAQSSQSSDTEWQEINTADFSDDLIWLFDGVDSIEGPRTLETDDYDKFPYWAPVTWPSTKYISQGDGT